MHRLPPRRFAVILLCLLLLASFALPAPAQAAPLPKAFSVKIQAPANGATVRGTVMVEATPSAPAATVSYRIDSGAAAPMSLTSTGRWTAPWDTFTATDGAHTLFVTATDSAGVTAQSSVSISVDNHYVTLQVVDPTENENVARTVLLQLKATSSTGTVTGATYTVAATTAPLEWNAASDYWEALWDSTTVAPGPVAITFRATDSTGATAAAIRNVKVIEPVTVTGEWTHHRGDLQARAATAEAYGTNFAQLWDIESAVSNTYLTLHNGTLYASSGGSPGYASSVDAASGRVNWSLRMEGSTGPLAVGTHGVYVSVFRTHMLALRPDGTTLWQVAIAPDSSPVVTEEAIYVADRYGTLYALDPLDGHELWRLTVSSGTFSKEPLPVLAEGRLFLPGYSQVIAVDLATRSVLYTIPTYARGMAYDNGLLYVGDGYALRAFDPATGQERWSYPVSNGVDGHIAAAQGKIVFGQMAVPNVYAVDALTGAWLWTTATSTHGSGYGAPVIAGDLVYIGAAYSGLKVLRLDTGEILATLTPDMDVQQTVIPAGGFLFVPERQFGLRALKRL